MQFSSIIYALERSTGWSKRWCKHVILTHYDLLWLITRYLKLMSCCGGWTVRNLYDYILEGLSYNEFVTLQVAEEIWVCEKQTVTKLDGSIFDFKNKLMKKMLKNPDLNKWCKIRIFI